ncbi:MAG: helix-turn-helix domain-containing protein [Paracoccaceae bacterium]
MSDDGLTAEQIKMAKAALGLSNPDVSQATGLNRNTIQRAESGGSVNRSTMITLRRFFEGEGVQFIPENGGGAGVRLRDRK